MQPDATHIPETPILRYFRSLPYAGPKGKTWGADRIAEAERLLSNPGLLAAHFAESAATVEAEYRNYQPFYPKSHTFGTQAKTKERHGESLRYTVDVAARLASKAEAEWEVEGGARLGFRYLDREIEIARANPSPIAPEGAVLKVDLFLANSRDRTPILCEVKIRDDQCPLYALIQLLTQAAYAATQSQRERLVLFGSTPDFVLREALPEDPPMLDLYVLLVEPPNKNLYKELRLLAIELGRTLIADRSVGERIGRIAWLEAQPKDEHTLTIRAIDSVQSRFRTPRN